MLELVDEEELPTVGKYAPSIEELVEVEEARDSIEVLEYASSVLEAEDDELPAAV